MNKREFIGVIGAGIVFPVALAKAFVQPVKTGLEGLSDDDSPQYILYDDVCCYYKDEWPWKGMDQHRKWVSSHWWKEVTFPLVIGSTFTELTWYRWPKERRHSILLKDHTNDLTKVPPFGINDIRDKEDLLTRNNPSVFPRIRSLIGDCVRTKNSKYCCVFEIEDTNEFGICCHDRSLKPLITGPMAVEFDYPSPVRHY